MPPRDIDTDDRTSTGPQRLVRLVTLALVPRLLLIGTLLGVTGGIPGAHAGV